jgi:hypothetical protein
MCVCRCVDVLRCWFIRYKRTKMLTLLECWCTDGIHFSTLRSATPHRLCSRVHYSKKKKSRKKKEEKNDGPAIPAAVACWWTLNSIPHSFSNSTEMRDKTKKKEFDLHDDCIIIVSIEIWVSYFNSFLFCSFRLLDVRHSAIGNNRDRCLRKWVHHCVRTWKGLT